MIVQCDNCHTKFNLNESAVPPEGAWVRCSNCGNTFEVKLDEPEAAATPPAEPEPQAQPEPQPEENADAGMDLDLGVLGESGADEAVDDEFDLTSGGGGKAKGGVGKFFKVVFWLIAIVVILAALGVGALVAMDRLGVGKQYVDQVRHLPGLSMLLTSKGKAKSTDKSSEKIEMALQNVRGSFRINEKAGRLFVIQGQVQNNHKQDRTKVLVRGRLYDKRGKAVREAVVYAGPLLTPVQLRQLPTNDIQATLAKPTGPDGSNYVVVPGGTMPFMIVFAGQPEALSEFTAELVGSEPLTKAAQ